MATPSSSDVTFGSGFIVRKSFFYVLTDEEVEGDDGSEAGLVLKYVAPDWGNVFAPFRGLVGVDALADPTEVAPSRPSDVTLVSVDGGWRRSGSARPLEVGVIDDTPDGPQNRGWIRGVRRVGHRLYAVGMSRQAYVRDVDAWRRIDAGLLAPPGETSGLNSIDGFSDQELYAVGLGGEIWRYDGARWHSIDSPTNVQLHDVRRVGDHVYIAGGSGVLLRGRGDVFAVVATEASQANLYAVEGFGDAVYVASLTAIYRLEADRLEKVRTGLRGAFTAGSLHAADGQLLSVGAKHILTTIDGVTWTQLFVT